MFTFLVSSKEKLPNFASNFNSYSPANMLDKLMNMRNKYLSENETLLARYAWGIDGNYGVQGLKNASKVRKKNENFQD